jgi:hypothetical protein
MTHREAVAHFREHILPAIQRRERSGHPDKPMRAEAWSGYVDSLHRDGRITDTQAQNFDLPAALRGEKPKRKTRR